MRVLGIDIGGTNIKSGIVVDGVVRDFHEMPTEAFQGGQMVMNKILRLITEYNNFNRIGISSAGQIDPATGQVIHATDNIPGWTGMRIKQIVEEQFSVPTCVENDVNAAAIAEAYYGAGKGKGSMVCLTFGTGIGGAIVEQGKLYHGSAFSAGEFGHITIHGSHRDCTCGNKGCYEVYASTKALINLAEEKLGISEGLNGRMLMAIAQENKSVYTDVINPWLEEVILGLRTLIHMFNPSLIVLGGGIMEQSYMLAYIREHIQRQIMPNFRNVVFLPAKLGNHAGIIGAAHLAMKME